MPRTRIALAACLGFVLIAGCSPNPGATATAAPSVQRVLREVQGILTEKAPPTPASFKRAIVVLTSGIAAHPDSIQLLRERANMYVETHDYPAARADLERADKNEPLSSTAKMLLCMLVDRTQGYPAAKGCFVRIAARFAQTAPQHAPPSANYVLAELLAGNPGAGKLRQLFLESHSRQDPVYGTIEKFDRETYIRQILP